MITIKLIIIIFMISLFLCFGPMMLNAHIAPIYLESDNIFTAFESSALKVVLGCCISLTIPVLLEILRDFLLYRSTLMSYNTTISNLLLIVSIIFPDLVIMLSAIPESNVRLFICVSQARLCAVVTSITVYIFLFGGKYWQSKRMTIAYIFGTIGNVGLTWTEFVPVDYYDFTFWLSATSIGTGMLIFSLDIVKWLVAVRRVVSDGITLSTNEYCCTVYICSALVFYSAHYLTFFLFGYPRYSQYNANYLILYNIYFGLLFITISVFQGGVARREVILEVSGLFKWVLICYLVHFGASPARNNTIFDCL